MSEEDILILKEKRSNLEMLMNNVRQLEVEISELEEKIRQDNDTQRILRKIAHDYCEEGFTIDSNELKRLKIIEQKYRLHPELRRQFHYFEESHKGQGVKRVSSKFRAHGLLSSIGITGEDTPPNEVFVGMMNKENENGNFRGFILRRTGRLKMNKVKHYRKIFDGSFVMRNSHSPYSPKKGDRFGDGLIGDRFMKEGVGQEYVFMKREKMNRVIFEGIFKENEKNGKGELFDIKNNQMICGEWRHGEPTDQIRQFDCLEVGYQEVTPYLTDENKIGSGTYGTIYRVKSSSIPSLGRKGLGEVAVKILEIRPQQTNREIISRMMKRGIECCSRIDSEYVVKVYGIIQGRGRLGYVMELGSGSLDNIIFNPEDPQPISMETKMKWLHQTAKGVAALHKQNLMHRDLKWGNCILCDEVVKIIDFESLKEDENSRRLHKAPHTIGAIGSPGFVAPEVFNKTGEYGMKCDVYSFGMMIYSLLWEVVVPIRTRKTCNCGENVEELINKNEADQHVVMCNLRPRRQMGNINRFPTWLVRLMELCYDEDPSCRPSFDEISRLFESKTVGVLTAIPSGEMFVFVHLLIPSKRMQKGAREQQGLGSGMMAIKEFIHLEKRILVPLKDYIMSSSDRLEKFVNFLEELLNGSKIEKITKENESLPLTKFDQLISVFVDFPENAVLVVHLQNTFALDQGTKKKNKK